MSGRRRAVPGLLLAACVTATAACDGGGSHTPTGAPPSRPAVGCVVPGAGPADAASVLRPGPTGGMAASDATGERLVIDGVVLDLRCRPAAAASLQIWHTDARGRYGPAGTTGCCYYKGTVRSDRDGRFRLETVRPGSYAGSNPPPAHIHFKISHSSGALTTQIVFGTGPAASVAPPTGESQAVPLERTPDGGWQGRAAFVLP